MKKRNKNQTLLINKKRLIYIPLLITLIIFGLMGFITLHYSYHSLLEQRKTSQLTLSKRTASYIDEYLKNETLIIENIEEKATIANKIITTSTQPITNDYLKKIAQDFNLAEINYYNNNGTIINSSIDDFIGWQSKLGDPIYAFITSDSPLLHEDIRQSSDSPNFYKYSCFRNSKGNTLQLGFLADDVHTLTDQFKYSSIIDTIKNTGNILYLKIFDPNLDLLATSDERNHYTASTTHKIDYQNTLKGTPFVFTWYSNVTHENILEVNVPLIIDGQTQGILSVGKNLENLETLNQILSLLIFLTFAIISFIFIITQRKFIIHPMLSLNNDIATIDIHNSADYYLPLSNKNPFKGIYNEINHLLQEIHDNMSKINTLNNTMAYAAYHHSLTDLPNRRFLIEKIEEALKQKETGGIILINLNDLKEINDTHGHLCGDEILKTIARRLNAINYPNLFLSHFSGDLFIILIIGNSETADSIYSTIIDEIHSPITINDTVFELNTCIGISLFPKDGTLSSELISKADLAQHYVKRNLTQGYAYFEKSMFDQLEINNETHTLIKDALKNDSFKLLYQPVIDVKTEKIVGFEALLRLKDSNLSPEIFIKVAEDKGLIIDIGRWVVKETIKQLSNWKKSGIEIKPIAVNFSPKQLKDLDFIDFLKSTLDSYEINPTYLEIEITENIFVNDPKEIIAFLEELRNMGIRVALDDFGSGYSSLNYLTYMPVDKIKLDKTINDQYLDHNNYTIIQHLINLFHDLDLKIIAEGIETKDQHRLLKQIDCDYLQGFLFSKPLDPTIIKQKLIDQARL